jgi:hypothetical protein
VASAGVVAAAVTGSAIAGALIGTVLARWLDQHQAEHLQEQLDRGGLLLWVRTPDADSEGRAVEILRRHSAHDVHTHRLPVKLGGASQAPKRIRGSAGKDADGDQERKAGDQ